MVTDMKRFTIRNTLVWVSLVLGVIDVGLTEDLSDACAFRVNSQGWWWPLFCNLDEGETAGWGMTLMHYHTFNGQQTQYFMPNGVTSAHGSSNSPAGNGNGGYKTCTCPPSTPKPFIIEPVTMGTFKPTTASPTTSPSFTPTSSPSSSRPTRTPSTTPTREPSLSPSASTTMSPTQNGDTISPTTMVPTGFPTSPPSTSTPSTPPSTSTPSQTPSTQPRTPTPSVAPTTPSPTTSSLSRLPTTSPRSSTISTAHLATATPPVGATATTVSTLPTIITATVAEAATMRKAGPVLGIAFGCLFIVLAIAVGLFHVTKKDSPKTKTSSRAGVVVNTDGYEDEEHFGFD